MQFSKKFVSAVKFVVAVALSFAIVTIGVGCSSDAIPPAADTVVGSDTKDFKGRVECSDGKCPDKDGPNAWQQISPICTEVGVNNLLGSEWTCYQAGACTKEGAYTCIIESNGAEAGKCAEIKCGDNWEDNVKNLVFFRGSDYFRRSKDGVEDDCTLVPPVAGTVKTIGHWWWEFKAVGPYTAPSMDKPGEIKAEVSFGGQGANDPAPSKAGCGVGENYITILFEGEGKVGAVWCIPSPSTGYDLHAPYAQTGTMIYTAYVMQSDAGFTDCPGGGHVKIVVKEDDGYGAGFSYTMCKTK